MNTAAPATSTTTPATPAASSAGETRPGSARRASAPAISAKPARSVARRPARSTSAAPPAPTTPASSDSPASPMPGAGYYVPRDRGLEESARAGAAHRRRRVRLRRDTRPARRRGHGGALRRVLDRDALAPGGLSARHAGTGGPRGDGRARHPRIGPRRPRLRGAELPRASPGDPRAADRPLGRLEARRRAPAQPARHPPGPPGRRWRGTPRLQADDDPRLRDSVEQLRLRLPGLRGARPGTSRTQGRRAREVSSPSSTGATPTRSTSGTSPVLTAST